MAYAAPIDCFSRNGLVGVVPCDAGISLFGAGPFFVHERRTSQAHFQARAKPILWQVTFDAITLNTIGVHNQNGWRPKCVEAMKPCGMLFDVGFDRDKGLVDKICDRLIAV